MRTIALIVIAACDAGEQAPQQRPAAAKMVPMNRETAQLALKAATDGLEGVTAVSTQSCMITVRRFDAGLSFEATIPLRLVAWDVEEKQPHNLGASVTATCTENRECINAWSESRTLDIPHQYSKHHSTLRSTLVRVPSRDAHAVRAELESAPARYCDPPTASP